VYSLDNIWISLRAGCTTVTTPVSPLPTPTTPPPSPTPMCTATPTPSPTLTPEIKWLDGDFKITHYTFALESDPVYANDPKVSAKGFPPNEKYREGFLYGPYGVLMQGTGLTENGEYVTIDWTKGVPQGKNTFFTHGIGGQGGKPEAWQTIATGDDRLPLGSRIIIEIYRERGVFTVNDTGGGVGACHIDVFVGAITLEEANELGTRYSRVGIVH